MDAAFLAMETREQPGHIGTLMFFRANEDGPLTRDIVRDILAERVDTVGHARSVVSEALGGVLRPSWVDAHDFDLDEHLVRVEVPATSWAGAVARFVAEAHSTPLDRRRPLWGLWVIEGMPEGYTALYAKVHVVMFDSATGAELITALLDDAADPFGTENPQPTSTSPLHARLLGSVPDQARRAAGFPVRLTTRSLAALRAQGPTWMEAAGEIARRTPELDRLARLVPAARGPHDPAGRKPPRAPRLSFNAEHTDRRSIAFGAVSVPDVVAVKRATGATFNDVVVAMSAGALRSWLIDHDELPSSPTVALLPLLVRGRSGNVGATPTGMMMPLPTDVDDPLERLRRTQSALRHARDRHHALPASSLIDLSMFAPAVTAATASRFVKALPHRSMIGPKVNLAITNVLGTRRPVTLAGRELRTCHPLQPINDIVPLNLSVQSVGDELGIGAVACRDHMDDLVELVSCMETELATLHDAVVVPSRGRRSAAAPARPPHRRSRKDADHEPAQRA
jgi:WS/DGAT/MGAT family acyltransferase